MSDNLHVLRDLIRDALAAGHTLVCTYGNGEEPDYTGTNLEEAMKALTACDEMWLILKNSEGKRVGSAYIIPDQSFDPDEVIADYGGDWMEKWHQENLSFEALLGG